MEENLRIIISGGGTGGHIFPAVSIANAIKEQHPEAEILFVGAEGRMEMQRVPAAGYPIKGLPVAGFDRKNLLKNVSVLFKFVRTGRILSAGHGGSQVIRNHHRDIGTVIHRIQQTGHTGMSEGRVTDNSNGRKYPCIGSTFGHGYGSTHIHTTVDSTERGQRT